MKYVFIVFALLAGINQAAAQSPVISSFSQNGLLVCTNLQPYSAASVQWASSLSGPWQSNWAGLTTVTVGANGSIQVSVPMYYRVLAVSNPPTTNIMALIPAGSFTMGDTLDGESDAIPTVIVDVSAFYMDTNLVSYGLWEYVFSYATNHGYQFENPGVGKAANNPVQQVSWFDCVAWCNARSKQAGLTPVYYNNAGLTQVYTSALLGGEPYVNWGASGFRLPTEAEWEKAARGGLSGQRFPLGDTISEYQANYVPGGSAYDLGPPGYNAMWGYPDFPPATSPAGYFAANGYGLCDMAGNVFEWCWDWYGTPYGQPTMTNPTGPAFGSDHVFRGGCWDAQAVTARCAHRNHQAPLYENWDLGFRCVRGL